MLEETVEHIYVDIPLSIYFSTKDPVEVQKIARALLALEQMSKRFPKLLTELTGVDLGKNYELRVSKVESGSLLTELVCRFVLDDPEKKAAFDKFLKEHPKLTKFALGSLITMLLITGALSTLALFQKSDSSNIENSYNTTINITADSLDQMPDFVRSAAEDAITRNSKKSVQQALTITAPAADDPEATITFGYGDIGVNMPREAIDEIDFSADLTATDHVLPHENVTLQVVALNRENPSAGWTGRVVNIGDRLLRIELADGIDPKELAYHDEYIVDGDVTFRNDINEGVMVPKTILITSIHSAR